MTAENPVQLNLFDFGCFCELNSPIEEEAPIFLEVNQPVWYVCKSDVISYYSCSTNRTDEYADLHLVDGNTYERISYEDIGKKAFLTRKEADTAALSYLADHRADIILADEIQPEMTKAYCYVRKCDERTMIAFYSVLPDGNIYMKRFTTYAHILDCKGSDKLREKYIRDFLDQQEFRYCNPKSFVFLPQFKNMYRCSQDCDWMYADAEYGGCL